MLKLSSLFQKPQSAPQEKPTTPAPQESLWSTLAEGELLIDMYERPDAIVIRSLVAGARPEDIEISLHNDMLTIRGKREEIEEIYENQFLYRECYWGGFSRTIILPAHVDANRIEAFFKNGIMMVILPKMQEDNAINLQHREETEKESEKIFDEDEEE
ncbi:Hsp20/alpha crystallin family protein [Candidatus Uhrbacteria bacterium]|nr:Hsp20/alpha crystallin family protein [Candidatus Uhrbacteria bacterium]